MSTLFIPRSKVKTGTIEYHKCSKLDLSASCARSAHKLCNGVGRLPHGIKFECNCKCHQPGFKAKERPSGEQHWNYKGKKYSQGRRGVSNR